MDNTQATPFIDFNKGFFLAYEILNFLSLVLKMRYSILAMYGIMNIIIYSSSL